MTWLAGCRCLYRGYEHKDKDFLGFGGLVALVGCRRLTRHIRPKTP